MVPKKLSLGFGFWPPCTSAAVKNRSDKLGAAAPAERTEGAMELLSAAVKTYDVGGSRGEVALSGEDVVTADGCDAMISTVPVVKSLEELMSQVASTRSCLPKLEEFKVEGTSELEHVFGHEDETDTLTEEDKVRPKPKRLELLQLPSLVRFSTMGNHFMFPPWLNAVVEDCPNTTFRFTVNMNILMQAYTQVNTRIKGVAI
ncbi:hypothetical protein F3Y22_tig00012370pilonHSYRG00137 [Hibiscus syriacus]|uniref:Uncharacterized protein n=1 Tax=Hibiscus syriacus TaxID=106335 RepID=A0A6A3C6K3_HIBSY|nr:hypothetical protein F3Y22_tig00012370pilonHSYRG00137 [Hibiscus syriacus]